MTPHRRGRRLYVYVPQRVGFVERATGTSSAAVAQKIDRMIEHLRDDPRHWDLLEAVGREKKLTLAQLYEAYTGNRLDALRAKLRARIAGKHPEAWLIDRAVKPDRITRHWPVACAAARVTGYWLRDTRHSYGVRAILAGYPLWEVSKWLGHGSVAQTADVYLQFDYAVVRAIRAGTAEATTEGGTLPPSLTITGTR